MVGVFTGFECCYCRKSIDKNAIDPLDINIITNGEMKKKSTERMSQNFYSHYDCFRKMIDKNLQGTMVADYDEI